MLAESIVSLRFVDANMEKTFSLAKRPQPVCVEVPVVFNREDVLIPAHELRLAHPHAGTQDVRVLRER